MSRFLNLLAAVALVALSAGQAAAQPAGFAYTLQNVNSITLENQIFGFSIDSLTGALTLLPSFPISTGGRGDTFSLPERMTYANGRLYVINAGTNTLSAFKVNRTTGALTPLPFNPIALGAGSWRCDLRRRAVCV